MEASIIIPIQVASDHFTIFLKHLEYSVASAQAQTVQAQIIIVDYNSKKKFSDLIKRIANMYMGKYIRDDREDTMWARGRALNVGIRNALGDLLLFVDADCVLPNNYVSDHMSSIDNTCFTFSEFYLTDCDIVKSACYEKLLLQKTKIKPPYATCCSHQGVLQETIRKFGMFDEVYRGWGAEEHDYIHTLKLAGIKPKQCKAMPIHLYHPTWHDLMRSAGRDEEQRLTRAKNKARYSSYVKTNKK